MSSGARYKFNGSTFEVQTGFGGESPTPVISNITQADPGVITHNGSTTTDGDVFRVTAVAGMTELNNTLVVADNSASTSFEMAGIDTTNNDAYTSGGLLDEVTFSDFCELTGATQQDGTSDQIDATTICSTAKEFEVGLSDSGTLQMDYNFAPLGGVQTALRAAKESGDQLAFRIVFPNSGGTIIMIGSVQQSSFQGQTSNLWTGSTTVKLTGPIFVLP